MAVALARPVRRVPRQKFAQRAPGKVPSPGGRQMHIGGAPIGRNLVEQKLRRFRAAFYITPTFSSWVRTRAYELERAGQRFEIIMVWGGHKFRADELPSDDPHFAIEHPDGSVERSRWCPYP